MSNFSTDSISSTVNNTWQHGECPEWTYWFHLLRLSPTHPTEKNCTSSTVKHVFFMCPLFHIIRDLGKVVKIKGREYLNLMLF